MKEERVKIVNNVETFVSGYFLTIDELQKLLKSYKDNVDYMGSERSYIENWLRQNT